MLSFLLVDGAVNPLLKYHFHKLLHGPRTRAARNCSRFLALRRDLFMLDTRFNTVGTDCIFATLQGAGVLSHELPEIGDIAPALTEAPDGTRAHLRGKAIKTLAEQKGENFCGWEFVTDQINGTPARPPRSVQSPGDMGAYPAPAAKSTPIFETIREVPRLPGSSPGNGPVNQRNLGMIHPSCRTADNLALDSRRLIWAAAEAVSPGR